METPEEKESVFGEEDGTVGEVHDDNDDDEEEEDEDEEGLVENGGGDEVCFGPVGVKIHMEDEESGFNSSPSLLPVPGLFGAKSTSSTNPLIRLASRTSIKLLCGATTATKQEKEEEGGSGNGVTAPYYPIFLPIDQDFKAKYIWHHRMAKRGKSLKERTYSFLEHPVGWLCFFYHMSV